MPARRSGNRRRWLAVGLVSACVSLGALGQGCTQSAAHDMPVVLIVIDTLRADHLGLYGYSRPTSPVLDGWAQHAAVFERAFSTSPWTLPSFASMYTCRLPSRHAAGIAAEQATQALMPGVNADTVAGRTYSALDPSLPTLAEVLREHGYATAGVVNNPFLAPGFGVARGFESYDYAKGWEMRAADASVERAIAYVKAHAARPFFLLLHLFDPHMDYAPPPAVRGRFTGAYNSQFSLPLSDLQRIRDLAPSLSDADRGFITAAYDEEVAFVDAQLGRFFDALDESGVGGRALVIVTADHGEELFDHGGFEHGHTMYDELLRVPLLLRGPGVRAGRLSTAVSLNDLTPTILAAVGVAPPRCPFADSLWPAVTGVAPVPSRSLFAERTLYGDQQEAMIRWPLKLVFDATTGQRQLFDLASDPGERRDRAAGDATMIANLFAEARATLDTARQRAAAPVSVRLDASTRERLRALGYAH